MWISSFLAFIPSKLLPDSYNREDYLVRTLVLARCSALWFLTKVGVEGRLRQPKCQVNADSLFSILHIKSWEAASNCGDTKGGVSF